MSSKQRQDSKQGCSLGQTRACTELNYKLLVGLWARLRTSPSLRDCLQNRPQVFYRDVYIHTLEEGMTTHSSVLAWRIPWTGGAWQATSMGLQRVSHN